MTVLPVVTGLLYRSRTQTIIRQKVYFGRPEPSWAKSLAKIDPSIQAVRRGASGRNETAGFSSHVRFVVCLVPLTFQEKVSGARLQVLSGENQEDVAR